jgi:hypothetical protein
MLSEDKHSSLLFNGINYIFIVRDIKLFTAVINFVV